MKLGGNWISKQSQELMEWQSLNTKPNLWKIFKVQRSSSKINLIERQILNVSLFQKRMESQDWLIHSPMDADPYTTTPTRECEIHSWAGFIMLLALLVAPILISVTPTGEVISVAFRLFSFVSAVLACVFLFMLARAFKQKRSAGLHQRVSYGIQLLWLSVLSMLLL